MSGILDRIRERIQKFGERMKPSPRIGEAIAGLQAEYEKQNLRYLDDGGPEPTCRIVDEYDLLYAVTEPLARSVSEVQCVKPNGTDCVVRGSDQQGLPLHITIFLPDDENQWCEVWSFIVVDD